MKKTSPIKLLTTLLFFSHNASAIDEFCYLETGENDSLPGAIDCLSGTWTKILNATGNTEDQTSFSLDKIGRQIIDETSRTNDDASNQSSGFSHKVPNLDFNVHDSGQQYAKPSVFFTETENTTENTGDLSPQNSGDNSFLQKFFDFLSAPENHSFEDNTLSTDNFSLFSEAIQSETSNAGANDRNAPRTEPLPMANLPESSDDFSMSADVSPSKHQPLLRKRAFSELYTPPEQDINSRPSKKPKISKHGYGHLDYDEQQTLKTYIENHPNQTTREIAENVKRLNIEISSTGVSSFKKKLKRQSTRHDLNREQRTKIRNFIKSTPDVNAEKVSNFAIKELNLELCHQEASIILSNNTNPSGSYKHLSDREKEIISDFIDENPEAKGAAISKYAYSVGINLNILAAGKFLKAKKRTSCCYSHLSEEQQDKVIKYCKLNSKAKPAQISIYAKKELGVELLPEAVRNFKKYVVNKKK